MLRSDEVGQPEWYILVKAANWLGNVAPWELEALPEPKKTFWIKAAMVGSNAEAEADQLNNQWT